MTELKIKDNSLVGEEDIQIVRHITKKIADKTIEQLAKEGVFVFPEFIEEAQDITKEQMILQKRNNQYRSSNIMGFFSYGPERLTIESRFSTDEHDYFFQYLLERVIDFPCILSLNADANQDNRLFNILMFLFPDC